MREEREKTWILSEEFLYESAEKRFEQGDYLGALTMLNKRALRYAPSADAWALYADIYEAMELYPLAADAWFRFLDTCNEADFAEGYEGLAIAFMNMGNEMQSAFYYHRAITDGEASPDGAEGILTTFTEETHTPQLRLVEDGAPDPETLREGLMLLQGGELESAREKLAEVDERSSDYPSAMGLSAMCMLMLGDEEGAERECEKLLETHPENIQALTTYCAVLGARGNKEGAKDVARRLAAIGSDSTDDMYRIATALCETGLDEEAFKILTRLKQRLPNDENVLWFHAVAAYHIGELAAGIESLDRLTTLYPRKAVAGYYLVRMRELRDGDGEQFPMSYYYRVPEEEYRTVANFLLAASNAEESELIRLSQLSELDEFLRIAFDEMEGRDEKLQMLAARVAAKTHSDAFLREVLLNCEGDDIVKLSILHDLVQRNAENSFGTVFLNIYREFFIHELHIGEFKRDEFMRAFADVYSKYALLGEENENKLCAAAEDIYASLEEAEAWEYFNERAALSAAIYREARLPRGERSLDEIVKMFDADKYVTQSILNFMI